MNRIDKKFMELTARKRKAFIAYITAGDPTLAVTARLVPALERAGVDILELGIPFSDPLADGPTIQEASQRALRKGVNLDKCFKLVRSLRKKTGIPIAFMTYYNPVLKYGLKDFIAASSRSGVDGVIVPDLPFEEASGLMRLARREGVATINLVAPTSTRGRMKNIAGSSTGFIYYVSLTGVTGARSRLPDDVRSRVKLMKSLTRKPVCVGFGVSNPGQARNVAAAADGVIVGSAIIKVIEKNLKSASLVAKVSKFAGSLAKAIHNA